jgi:hypothetical protein
MYQSESLGVMRKVSDGLTKWIAAAMQHVSVPIPMFLGGRNGNWQSNSTVVFHLTSHL